MRYDGGEWHVCGRTVCHRSGSRSVVSTQNSLFSVVPAVLAHAEHDAASLVVICNERLRRAARKAVRLLRCSEDHCQLLYPCAACHLIKGPQRGIGASLRVRCAIDRLQKRRRLAAIDARRQHVRPQAEIERPRLVRLQQRESREGPRRGAARRAAVRHTTLCRTTQHVSDRGVEAGCPGGVLKALVRAAEATVQAEGISDPSGGTARLQRSRHDIRPCREGCRVYEVPQRGPWLTRAGARNDCERVCMPIEEGVVAAREL